jgi:hypothetical protein
MSTVHGNVLPKKYLANIYDCFNPSPQVNDPVTEYRSEHWRGHVYSNMVGAFFYKK